MNETMGMSYASLYYAEVGKNNELQKENKKLKELCDKYEEEHNNEFQCWKRDRKELLDKRNRINKAVELLLDKYVRCLLNDNEVNNIVKILKGDNK